MMPAEQEGRKMILTERTISGRAPSGTRTGASGLVAPGERNTELPRLRRRLFGYPQNTKPANQLNPGVNP